MNIMRQRFLSNVAAAIRNSNRITLHSTRTPAELSNSNKPPILMVHGALASEATYRSLMKRTDFGKFTFNYHHKFSVYV